MTASMTMAVLREQYRSITAHSLADACGSALLDICLDADRQVDTGDDDLHVVLWVLARQAEVCHEVAAAIDWYRTRSWRYRLVCLGAWLFWQSRWARETDVLWQLEGLCQNQQRLAVSIAKDVQWQAGNGHPGRVTTHRKQVLTSLWAHARDCLTWGDPR